MMTSNGHSPVFGSESCVMKSTFNGFSDGEGTLVRNGQKKVESSRFDLDTKLENCDLGSSSLVDGGDPRVTRTGGGSIAERRAAKFGFNASEVYTPWFRSSNSPLPSPSSRSPYLTIPDGISPTELLESPILLPNSQLSPTTGTFTSQSIDGDGQILVSTSSTDTGRGFDGNFSSSFEPDTDLVSSCLPAFRKQGLVSHFESQSLKSLHPPGEYGYFAHVHSTKEVAVNNHGVISLTIGEVSEDLPLNDDFSVLQPSLTDNAAGIQMEENNDPSQEEVSEIHDSLDGDHKGKYSTTETVRTAEDGYNWRKYGQKQVKGSEYPRSYYKCTHPDCHVKKKVERSHEGHITEIIYKGAHNHPRPQLCQKSTSGSSLLLNEASDVGEGSQVSVKGEGGSIWRNMQPGLRDGKFGSDRRTDGLEMTSSTSVITEVSDPLSTTQGKPIGLLESEGTPEFSSTLISNEDDEEDTATEGNFPLGDDNDSKPDSKRRKKDLFEPPLGSRAVREPRVVIQIESEIDVLDDGYRWRKYGQKVVKGNPNPRSYYKCTSAGCIVKKHVERASHNLKFVITTYEGKHNHEVPTARNSSHANSGSGTSPPLTTNPHLPKPELYRQDLPLLLNAKLDSNPDYFRPNFLGNLEGGVSPFYQMKFPSLQLNARPCGPFSLNNHQVAYPGGSNMIPAITDMTIPMTLGFPPSNPTIADCSNPLKSLHSIQPMFAAPQSEECNVKLLRLKQEQGDDSFHDLGMHKSEHTKSSSSLTYSHRTTFHS